jgi:predicted amidohydrolase
MTSALYRTDELKAGTSGSAAPATTGFRLAMVQMRVEGGRPEENLERTLARIDEAAGAGVQVVLLPEAVNLGWTHPSAWKDAEGIPGGRSSQLLVERARKWHIFLCAGLVERYDALVFNSAVLIGPNGEILLHHRKINELEIGHPYYALGNKLQTAKTPLANFGLMICADAFAPGQSISRSLALMGADVILSPCAWAVPADHDNTKEPYGGLWLDCYGRVARDFRIWIAGASNVGRLTEGPWAGRKCIGCSLLVGPSGNQVVMGPYGTEAETILYAEVKPVPRPAQGDGWQSWWERASTERIKPGLGSQ